MPQMKSILIRTCRRKQTAHPATITQNANTDSVVEKRKTKATSKAAKKETESPFCRVKEFTPVLVIIFSFTRCDS